MRLFIAIALPQPVKDEAECVQKELRRSVPDGSVRWTTPEQFHLTLRFLGQVEEDKVAALQDAFRRACENFAPLELRAQGIGFFPNPRSPRVIWVGIEEITGRLAALQGAIQEQTQGFTAEAAEKKFTGHITLGRVKGLRHSEAQCLAQCGARLADKVLGEWTAAEVLLYQSELSPKGARHSVLCAAPLSGK